MSRASIRRATSGSDLGKLMRQAAGRRNLYDVFSDFCEMAAISISNAVDLRARDAREARYMQIVKRYEPHEVALFPQMLAALVDRMEGPPDDVLGRLFSELELHNAARGQFFTPYSVCQLMASINIKPDDLRQHIEQRGYVTIMEPAAGAGAMVIAFADMMRQAGHNPQTQLHATLQDIDSRAVHMAYLHLSLLHIPAAIVLGNTLACECREVWYTPAHILGGWGYRLRLNRENPMLARASNDNEAPTAPAVQAQPEQQPEPVADQQLALESAPIEQQPGPPPQAPDLPACPPPSGTQFSLF